VSKVTSVVNEWVRIVEIDEKLKTTDEDGTDVGRSVVGNDKGQGPGYDRVLLHAPVGGVRMEAMVGGGRLLRRESHSEASQTVVRMAVKSDCIPEFFRENLTSPLPNG
jgi:hypothetical protein